MPRDVGRASLYRGSIILWVEDELTRAYLSEIWNDSSVAYFIAGGHEGVNSIVKDAEKAGFSNVFGLIDRDFRKSNAMEWMNPKKTFRTFILPVHEIENYLLDSDALSNSRLNNISRVDAEIQSIMKSEAEKRRSSVACRDTIAFFRARFRGRFLNDPTTPPVFTSAEALIHICESPWYQSLARKTSALTQGRVQRLLDRAHGKADEYLAVGRWKTHFAGKEIYHAVGSMIFDRARNPAYRPTKAEFDADLAKDIAAWQVEHQTVPSDLTKLLAALRARIARIPG